MLGRRDQEQMGILPLTKNKMKCSGSSLGSGWRLEEEVTGEDIGFIIKS
jgi:hypothetical protein